MITGEDICKREAEKAKAPDYASFKAGWYARENFFSDNRPDTELLEEIKQGLSKIEQYMRRLYRDFEIDEQDRYMGHEDPLGNTLCLLAHIRGASREIAERRQAQQYLLFA